MNNLVYKIGQIGIQKEYPAHLKRQIQFANIYVLWILPLCLIPLFFIQSIPSILLLSILPITHSIYWLFNYLYYHNVARIGIILHSASSIFLASILLGNHSHTYLFFFIAVLLPIFLVEKFFAQLICWLLFAICIFILKYYKYSLAYFVIIDKNTQETFANINNFLIILFGILISYHIKNSFQRSEKNISYLLEQSNRQNRVLLKHHEKVGKQNLELEHLNKQLSEYKNSLEEKVLHRTQEIEKTKAELRSLLAQQEEQNQILIQKEQEIQIVYKQVLSQNQQLQESEKALQSLNQSLQNTQETLKKAFEKERSQKNITEKLYEDFKKAQFQLLESEKMASLGLLTTGIVHEINNPLNFVLVGMQTLSDNIKDIGKILEMYKEKESKLPENDQLKIVQFKEAIYFENIWADILTIIDDVRTGAKRINEIVRSIRVFAHHEDKNIQNIDIEQVIGFALTILKGQYKNHIDIELQYDKLPLIMASAGQLSQVFINLLANFIQAIDQKGKIFITTKLLDQKNIQISITDTGKGIPKEIQNRIFEPLFTTKEVGKGTGLGLSISKSIIEKHQGSIDFVSEENKGTSFEIILPIHQKV